MGPTYSPNWGIGTEVWILEFNTAGAKLWNNKTGLIDLYIRLSHIEVFLDKTSSLNSSAFTMEDKS